MNRLKCLVVDDSVVYRTHVRKSLEDTGFCEVVASVSNGRFALNKVHSHSIDLVILDLEMPELDGLETIRALNKEGFEGAIIMFASSTQRSADVTLEALNLGARDFIAKPNSQSGDSDPTYKIRSVLEPKIKAIFPRFNKEEAKVRDDIESENFPKVIWDLVKPKILVIGSSTGGPTALETIIKELKPPFSCPIVITQHMPPVFTNSFAKRMNALTEASVFEATDDLLLQPNHVYVAPGGFHLALKGRGAFVRTKLIDGDKINSIKPSIDPLFQTASEIYGAHCMGMILTGMGSDGLEGSKNIKRKGGAIMIQSKESCAVWGMPAAVHRAGAYDKIGSIEEIIKTINSKIGCASPKNSLKIRQEEAVND